MSGSVPAYIPCLSLFLTVNQRFAAMIVETVRLDQVDYIKLVDLILTRVAYSEKEPLAQLLWGSMIEFQIQIIFKFTELSGSMEIAALKPRFKNQRSVVLPFKIVILVESIIVASIENCSIL